MYPHEMKILSLLWGLRDRSEESWLIILMSVGLLSTSWSLTQYTHVWCRWRMRQQSIIISFLLLFVSIIMFIWLQYCFISHVVYGRYDRSEFKSSELQQKNTQTHTPTVFRLIKFLRVLLLNEVFHLTVAHLLIINVNLVNFFVKFVDTVRYFQQEKHLSLHFSPYVHTNVASRSECQFSDADFNYSIFLVTIEVESATVFFSKVSHQLF